MSKRFTGKVCLVTGGARNIGFATVKAFLDEGASVAIIDRNPEALEKATSLLLQRDPTISDRLFTAACDISSEPEVADTMKTIARTYGSIDVLVNNAGVCTLNTALDLTVEEWDLVLGVNLKGAWLCVKHAAPHMRDNGSIVNIASQAAQRAQKFTPHYSASKMGVIGLTRALAVELAPRLRVNAVSPGTIATDMIQQEIDWRIARKVDSDADGVMKAWLDRIPMGRFQEPEQVARSILFLASSDASETTGETLNVSGGAVMI
jgi:NAD(P)-dependent dehydrogenase (short-subunit alcohol dehydrogenase family)